MNINQGKMKGNWLCTLVKPNLSKEGGMGKQAHWHKYRKLLTMKFHYQMGKFHGIPCV